jgi:hypothetical protein
VKASTLMKKTICCGATGLSATQRKVGRRSPITEIQGMWKESLDDANKLSFLKPDWPKVFPHFHEASSLTT